MYFSHHASGDCSSGLSDLRTHIATMTGDRTCVPPPQHTVCAWADAVDSIAPLPYGGLIFCQSYLKRPRLPAAMEWYFQPLSQSFLVAVDELNHVSVRFDYESGQVLSIHDPHNICSMARLLAAHGFASQWILRAKRPLCSTGVSQQSLVHMFTYCLRLCFSGFLKGLFGHWFLQVYLFRASCTPDWFSFVCVFVSVSKVGTMNYELDFKWVLTTL